MLKRFESAVPGTSEGTEADSEQCSTRLIRHIASPAAIVDLHSGRIFSANSDALAALGLREDSFAKTPISDLIPGFADLKPDLVQVVRISASQRPRRKRRITRCSRRRGRRPAHLDHGKEPELADMGRVHVGDDRHIAHPLEEKIALTGISKINTGSDPRLAAPGALRWALTEKPDLFNMYQLMGVTEDAMDDTVRERIQLFGGAGKT